MYPLALEELEVLAAIVTGKSNAAITESLVLMKRAARNTPGFFASFD